MILIFILSIESILLLRLIMKSNVDGVHVLTPSVSLKLLYSFVRLTKVLQYILMVVSGGMNDEKTLLILPSFE